MAAVGEGESGKVASDGMFGILLSEVDSKSIAIPLCPNCKQPFHKVIAVNPPCERINEFGRKEIYFEVVHHQVVSWEGDHYHCNYCGANFSFKEFTMQSFKDVRPKPDEQTKLFTPNHSQKAEVIL